MNGIYNWMRKMAGRGWVICALLGFLAGVACGRWMPDALMVAALLAVATGMAAPSGLNVGASAMIFVCCGAMGIELTMYHQPLNAQSYQMARDFVLQTPWQIIWVIPLQLLGYGLRNLLTRGR